MKLAVAPTPATLAQQARYDELERIEDKLFNDHLRIVNASSRFMEVHPDRNTIDMETPDSFVEAAGGDLQRGTEDYRIALASWLGPKDAPLALHNAYKIAMGIAKLRGEQRNAQQVAEAGRPLAIHVHLPPPVPKGERIIDVPCIEVEK